ncbi:MAG: HEAT repeat domain-containing protein [Cyanobacteria bacterium P01_D01_bin.123]
MPVSSAIAPLIAAVQAADSSEQLLDAVRDLADVADETAVPILIEALGYNNPGAAVAAVDGLVVVGKPAVAPLLTLIDNYNYGARAWAVRALAGIADPRALEILLDSATTDFSFSVRRAAARGLGNLRWSDVAADRLLSDQIRAGDALLLATQDGEWVVRYAAVLGLQLLGLATVQPEMNQNIGDRLHEIYRNPDEEIAVRARAQMALQVLQSDRT